MTFRLSALLLLLLASFLRAADVPVGERVELAGAWKFCLDPKDVGQKQSWSEANFDDGKWKEINVPGSWESQGYEYNGVAWYRKSAVIPEAWRGRQVYLMLPTIDETDETFVNGEHVGGMAKAFQTPRLYPVPESLIRFGQVNVIAVRVTDLYGSGGMSNGAAGFIVPGALTPEASSAGAPMDLRMTEGISERIKSWKFGWRDEGTADTKPRLHARPGAFDGKDAVGIEAWFPNSTEYVEFKLDPRLNGNVWQDRKLDYISFYCRGVETGGEMTVALNTGTFTWKGGGLVYSASFFVPAGEWRRVILPFSAFMRRGEPQVAGPMPGTRGLTTVSLGFENNALRGPGEIQFAQFEAGSFAATASLAPLQLEALWRFAPDTGDDAPSADQFDDSSWAWLKWGQPWVSLPSGKNAAAGWFRQSIVLPESWNGLPLELSLGRLASEASSYEVWVNGKPLGATRPKRVAQIHLDPSLLRAGANTLAIRVRDDKMFGRSLNGPYVLTPTLCQLRVRDRESGVESSAVDFEHAPTVGRNFDLAFALPAALSPQRGMKLSYTLVDCFHRAIRMGEADVEIASDGSARAVASLTPEESRQFYFAEVFSMRAILLDAQSRPVAAFAAPSVQMKYGARDTHVVAAAPETIEETPYGKLKLVDEIDATQDPATDPHPYKEGGIRASWVGRRAYSTWERGVSINEFKGRKYREVNNNEWFGYRIGRGKIKPHTAYVLRVEYPEDKTRYMVMNIDASRNYQGTGFKTGVSPNDPNDPYPLSGNYEWYDHFVFPDDTTYGFKGSRTAPGENGFWVYFHDNGRLYTSQYQAGPAVARIKLYEITDLGSAMPKITYPGGEPRRMLISDWEREPEAVPLDTVRYAQLMGWNAISPEVFKWSAFAYYRTKLNVRIVKPVRDPLPDGETPMYEQYLDATRQLGMTIIPRLEYVGTNSIPENARAIGANGKIAEPNRFHTWCSDLLQPVTWDEFSTLLEEVVGSRIKDNPQIGGVQWRIRCDRMPISYSSFDLELFTKETGKPADLKAVTKGGALKSAYEEWWHGKRRDFHVRLRDQLRGYRPDLKLYYYNWDPDGWSLGKIGSPESPQEWSTYYNVKTSRQFYEKEVAELAKKKPDYLAMFLAGAKQRTYGGLPHHTLRTEMYKDVDGVALLAPVHWNYLANDEAYINYFRTGDGLAVTNVFNYEEKGRTNVQGDNYESSEMTPGGPTFAMAEEVLACYHGDPTTFTTTTYTFGRGFAAEHRRFAQAFLALPAKPGTIVSTEGDVRVRRYESKNGAYVGVVNRGYTSKPVTVRIEGAKGEVVDLVTGAIVPSKTDGGALTFEVTADAMSLHSFVIR